MEYRGPALTVDCVVLDDAGRLLLIKRKNEPFAGQYALPGGFVELGETLKEAALRELQEETGVGGRVDRLIGVYSDPARDPRGHTVSVAYSVIWDGTPPRGGDDAAEAEFVEDWDGLKLAFDHKHIVIDATR